MGHQHLQGIPRTKDWRQVVALIGGGGSLEDVAAATAKAVERGMIDASEDPCVRQAFYLLTQIPVAARSGDFAVSLQKIGLEVDTQPSLIEVCSAMMDSIDRFASRLGHRTDFGEMAQLAAVEALHSIVSRELADFEPGYDRLPAIVAGLATPRQFAILSREFFSRLTRRHLNFYLQRELSNHVGVGRRFNTIGDHLAFDRALDLHCREASRIIKEFSGEWFSKHLFEGGVDREKAGRFVHVASEKIRDELSRRRLAHA
jgi:hypothetical protein